MAFEQLVAEAAAKKESKKKNKDKKSTPETSAADAPNVPRTK